VRRAESGASQDAADRLHALLRWSDVGLHLTRPWRVVLTGRTNVGKSSLINALLGYERSIVYGEPGTTRDVVTAHTAIDGWPVELADTAGLRASDDAVELAGVDLAHRVLAQADVVVLVFDASRPWLTDDASLVRDRPDALVVHNKCDQPMVDVAARPPGLSTSATEGRGVPEVVAALSHRLVPTPPPPGTAIPFTARQVEAIRAGLSALQAGRVGELTAALAEELTGCAGTWDGWG
jgi:tRNA modification GTPase